MAIGWSGCSYRRRLNSFNMLGDIFEVESNLSEGCGCGSGCISASACACVCASVRAVRSLRVPACGIALSLLVSSRLIFWSERPLKRSSFSVTAADVGSG